MIDKKGLAKNNAFHLALILVVALSLVYVVNFATGFIVGDYTILNASSSLPVVNYTNATGLTVNEDVPHNYTILINTTTSVRNITQINVSLWGNFAFNNYTNYTGGNITSAPAGLLSFLSDIFSNTTDGQVLTWKNSSAGTVIILSNVTFSKSIIAFNLTAPTPGKYNLTLHVFFNSSRNAGTFNETNITVRVNDTTRPHEVNISGLPKSYPNISSSQVINLSALDNGNLTAGAREYDVTGVNITILNSTNGVNASYLAFNVSGRYWNITLSTTQFPDGIYNISIQVNDTNGNVNGTNISNVRIDNTDPTASVVCSPGQVNSGDTVTCTCSPSDSLSGVNSSATSVTANPSTTSTGTFTESCSFADLAGNTASASATYTVEQSGSGATTSSGGTSSSKTTSGSTTTTASTTPTETASTKASHVFDSIVPGTPVVQTDVNADAGVKEISIEVNNPAQNVEITVTKHDGKPAEVSVEKAGKTYTYMQIEAVNLEDKLDKATIKIQVEKQWVADNGLTLQDIALFHYDGDASVWNQLDTSFSEEDDTFYYYTADVNSFSYFAIGQKVVVEPATTGKAKIIIGVILILVVLGIAAWYVLNRRKK